MSQQRASHENVLESFDKIIQFLLNSKDFTDDEKERIQAMVIGLKECGFLTAPCSTLYHCSYEGGLVEHTVHVCNTIMLVSKVLAPELSPARLVLTALCHDIGKYCMYYRAEPTERQKQYGYPGNFAVNPDIPYMNHEDRSLWFIAKYGINLTEEEWAAIAFHNVLFRTDDRAFFKVSKIAWLLAIADGWATTFIDEPGFKSH